MVTNGDDFSKSKYWSSKVSAWGIDRLAGKLAKNVIDKKAKVKVDAKEIVPDNFEKNVNDIVDEVNDGNKVSVKGTGKVSDELASLHRKFDDLADKHLLSQFREIDPNLKAGYTGSFKTGVVGNPNKATFGQSIDLSSYDIDYWIESDALYEMYGNSLKANPSFREILANTPGFEGLKPNKKGFSIKFKPSSK